MITTKEIKEYFTYDGSNLLWRISPKYDIHIGSVAGHKNTLGYIEVRIKGKLYLAHRLIWQYVNDEPLSFDIDHINHIRSDNRIENLRLVSHSINMRNQKLRVTNKSGYHGIRWYKKLNKWQARIMYQYKDIHLGYFNTIEEAISMRLTAEDSYDFNQNHGGVL